MNRHRTLALVLAALLAVSLVALAAPATASSGETVAIDDGHGLTSDTERETFAEDGVASTTETYPDVTLTVAESSEDVGLDGLRYTDFDTTYLRVEYDESIDRTLRFYVPDDYWHPHPDTLGSVTDDTTATLEPTSEGNYTAVEMHVDGETDAVFEVRKQASVVFNARDHGTDWLANETGVDIPRLDGSSDHWEYVPTEELTTDSPTVGIESPDGDVTLQYDAAGTADPADQAWRTLPECSSSAGGDAPVCWYDDSDPDRVNVLAQTDSPPDIRYHHDAGFMADVRASTGELVSIVTQEIPDDIGDFIDGVLS